MVDIEKKPMDGLDHGAQWEMDLYERAVEVFGDEAQVIKAAEELSELAATLNKLVISLIWNIGDEKKLEAKMRGEWADATIMLNQLHVIFGDNSVVELEKLEALEERLDQLEEEDHQRDLEELDEIIQEELEEQRLEREAEELFDRAMEEMDDCDG